MKEKESVMFRKRLPLFILLTLTFALLNATALFSQEKAPEPTLVFEAVPAERPTQPTDARDGGIPVSAEPITSPTEIAPVTVVPTVTTLPPEPPLTLLANIDFDGNYQQYFVFPVYQGVVPGEEGNALEFGRRLIRAVPRWLNFDDFVLEMRFRVFQGLAQITVGAGSDGLYHITIRDDGQVTLYREQAIVAQNSIDAIEPGLWVTLRVVLVDGLVGILVNEGVAIVWQDSNPIPTASFAFYRGSHNGRFMIDNLQVFVPSDDRYVATQQSPTSSPSMPPEPPLTVRSFDDFDENISHMSLNSVRRALVQGEDGMALEIGSNGLLRGATFYGDLEDVVLEARVRLLRSSARILFGAREVGQYILDMNFEGQVILYRDLDIVATGVLELAQPDDWFGLRVAIIQGGVRVTVNGDDVFTWRDPSPVALYTYHFFPTGQFSHYLLDNVRVLVPIDQLPVLTPTST